MGGFLKLKGLLFNPKLAEFLTPRHSMKSLSKMPLKGFHRGKTGCMLDITTILARQRFCQDLISPSCMNYADANAFDLQNRPGLDCI